MASENEAPKREPTPTPSTLSSVPQKRAFDEVHSPAVPSPLNPDAQPQESQHQSEDASQAARSKPTRIKKDSFKKREAKGESVPPTPDRKSVEPEQSESSPLRYKLAPPKPGDFDPARGPVLTLHHDVANTNGPNTEFFETSDHVFNKKNFRYTHCIADPLFPSMIYYRQTEPPPFGPRMSYEDSAAHVFFDKDARQVTTNKGFRLSRANVAVREGRWYWECKITHGVKPPKEGETKPQGGQHVRMGWARREASLDAPVGFDAYSYGFRDVGGEKVFMSRPKEFFPAGEGILEGDVIGLEIQLPSEQLHRKVMDGSYHPAVDTAEAEQVRTAEGANIVRDRVPIRFKAHTYFEKIEYHTTRELEELMNPTSSTISTATDPPNPNHPSPALRTLPNSHIKVYKNGVLMGTAFENLLGFLPPASKPMPQVGAREGLDDGMLGYYPAVSIFQGGAAEVNFGPNFWFPPPGYDASNGELDLVKPADSQEKNIHAVYERYREQIAEDIVYDIIDEVDFGMQDGRGTKSASGADGKSDDAVVSAPAREEIKELVQDD